MSEPSGGRKNEPKQWVFRFPTACRASRVVHPAFPSLCDCLILRSSQRIRLTQLQSRQLWRLRTTLHQASPCRNGCRASRGRTLWRRLPALRRTSGCCLWRKEFQLCCRLPFADLRGGSSTSTLQRQRSMYPACWRECLPTGRPRQFCLFCEEAGGCCRFSGGQRIRGRLRGLQRGVRLCRLAWQDVTSREIYRGRRIVRGGIWLQAFDGRQCSLLLL